MSKTLTDLRGMDELSSRYGCGLNPKLKAAIEADLRFPAKAAAPLPRPDDTAGPLPENVIRLVASTYPPERSHA
ncbi:MAG: hypothetical protein AAGK92_10810 [Pseudomonadota bacterium]